MPNYGVATLDLLDRGFGAATGWIAPSRRSTIGSATTSTPESSEVAVYVRGAVRLPKWFEAARDALNTIAALPSDWNSYSARRVEFSAVATAVSMLVAIMDDESPLPTFVPTASGGVLLEWHTAKADLEIEVRPSGRTHVVFEAAGSQAVETEGLAMELAAYLKTALREI